MLSWLSGRSTSVEELIAHQKYDKAIELIEDQLKERPGNARLRLQMGDVLAMARRTEMAIKVMLELAEEFAAQGFTPKAIAILKKIQRMDPNQHHVNEKIAELIRGRDESAPATSPSAVQPVEPREASAEAQTEVRPDAGSPPPLRSPLFSDFTHDELLAVIQGLRLVSCEPGEIILTEGQPGESLLILASGVVRAYVMNAMGQNVEVRTMEEGEFFGEISLLTGKPRSATITAATPCELLELDRKTLDEIAKDHPRVTEVVQEFHDQRSGSMDEVMARST